MSAPANFGAGADFGPSSDTPLVFTFLDRAEAAQLGMFYVVTREDRCGRGTRHARRCQGVTFPAIATVLLGAVGFGAGYYGPLVLNPDASIGPLLGMENLIPTGSVEAKD